MVIHVRGPHGKTEQLCRMLETTKKRSIQSSPEAPEVLALETGGRLSTETVNFVLQLAIARARTVPSYLRQASTYAFFRRWTRLLAVTAANALAASLLEDRHRLAAEPAFDGGLPWLLDLLAECRHDDTLIPSSMPLRPE